MITRWSIRMAESKRQISTLLNSLEEQCPLSCAVSSAEEE